MPPRIPSCFLPALLRTGFELKRYAIRRKTLLLLLLLTGAVIWLAIPRDFGTLDIVQAILNRHDADFEGPNGKSWRRVLDKCPANTVCIHLATRRFGSTSNWESVLGRRDVQVCSNTCQLVSQPEQAHGLLFHLFDVPSQDGLRRMHFTRPPGQVWIMYNLEPPVHISTHECVYTCSPYRLVRAIVSSVKRLFLPSYLLREYPETTLEAGFFNWTMTYRRDSTFYVPYALFKRLPSGVIRPTASPSQLVFGKRYLMYAAVSNCRPHNRRQEILHALQLAMELHVYGACGTKSLPPGEKSVTDVSGQYFFYLSIENSFCRDYITEKFYISGLMGAAVPVVLGATSKAEYEAVAPPNSFIYASDFPSTAALAQHLQHLAANPSEYAKLHAWKATHEMYHPKIHRETNPFCQICQKLRDLQQGSTKATNLDLNRFYNTGVECRLRDYWPFSMETKIRQK